MTDYQFNPSIEQWKDIPDFPGYEVSDHGKVRSYWKRMGKGSIGGSYMVLSPIPQRYFAQNIGSSGYVQIMLTRGGKKYNRRIHQMVIETFFSPCPIGMEGCHNDGDRKNNYFSNLRWDTRKNNIGDQIKHGRKALNNLWKNKPIPSKG